MVRTMAGWAICISLAITAIPASDPVSRTQGRTHVAFPIRTRLHALAIATPIWLLRIPGLRAGRCAVIVFRIVPGRTLVGLHSRAAVARWSCSRRRRHRPSIQAGLNRQWLAPTCTIWHLLVAPIVRTALIAHAHYTGRTSRRCWESVGPIDPRTPVVWVWDNGLRCGRSLTVCRHGVVMLERRSLGRWRRTDRVNTINTTSLRCCLRQCICARSIFWVIQQATNVVHKEWI